MRSRFALFLCLLVAASMFSGFAKQQVPNNLNFDPSGFLLAARGLFEGLGAAEGWDQLAPCINSTEDAVQNIILGIEDLKKQDMTDVARGLAELAKAFSDFPTSIQTCGAIARDVQALVSSLEAISNPASFIYIVSKNLIVNGVEIYNQTFTAVAAFEIGSYENFGYLVGEALAELFLHGSQRLQDKLTLVQEVMIFLQGVVEGISTDLPYNELAPCVKEGTAIGAMLEEAISDLRIGSPTKVVEGVVLLAKTLRAIPTAVKDCDVAYNQLEALIQAISLLEDPRAMVYHIAKSLIIHGQEIWHHITDATKSMEEGKYEAAGVDIGTIIANFIEPDKAVAGKKFASFLENRAPFVVNKNHKFVNWTKGELKSLFGTRLEDPTKSTLPKVTLGDPELELPENFSSLTQWPECEHPILDQAKCGSCWAFGAAETLSDRFCIASKGKVNVQLSPQYLVSCSTGNMGCNGGILTLAWASLERSGLPTLDCEPYESQTGTAPECSKLEEGCKDGTPLKRYYAKSWSTRWYMSTDSIKSEIFKNGPVESAFTVYEDFLSYAGGVYKHTSGAALGGHAIKIVGWGKENGQEYWLVANSWGTNWGAQGYFKMAIGDSEMDSNGVVGAADTDNLPTAKSRWRISMPDYFSIHQFLPL